MLTNDGPLPPNCKCATGYRLILRQHHPLNSMWRCIRAQLMCRVRSATPTVRLTVWRSPRRRQRSAHGSSVRWVPTFTTKIDLVYPLRFPRRRPAQHRPQPWRRLGLQTLL